ncbi:PREDICTED: protein SCAI-like isoform X2 [Tarenaya hassleriana]|uniref:protein SCAI-like isoform X2 n=1 Tax=Tarenaya hassleriana TaxID=28532 RepID=UPI00053C8E10|nr:PREDICTED: protein SCAI-like isoform X2 [Tarenaya hassleriana]
MSQQISGNSSSNILPLSEVYWSLVNKADKKFSKIRDLPFYERSRYETYFYKVFKVYTELWKFQQENRQKLVEAGLKRWEIGEIASRIAQLYYGHYMRTSDAGYLSESYIFYEAILTREYFREGLFQDLNIANKQLRFFARFLMVCLVLGRREMVHQLVDQFKRLIDDCRRTFQETDFKEWKLVVQEIARFLKADTAFMNVRPLRYSLVLDPNLDFLQHAGTPLAGRSLRLTDAILSSYHYNEVKYSELTLDAFRMLQCLEWEPSGSFYQSTGAKMAQCGYTGPAARAHPQNITDPTLPPNPRKAVLYRPSVTNFLAVLATTCEELPSHGVLLIYLSASGKVGRTSSSPLGVGIASGMEENIIRNFESHTINQGGAPSPPIVSADDGSNQSLRENNGDSSVSSPCGLFLGPSCVYPSDLVPFTRRPLFIVIDSESSASFKSISGAEKGEPAALLLSPTYAPPLTSADMSRHPSGSLFTIFLTAPIQAFCLVIGISGPDVEMDKAEKLLSLSMNEWGSTLATSDTLHPVWVQILKDPFLRRLLLRFLFCRAVLMLYAPNADKTQNQPECSPALPDSLLPTEPAIQSTVFQMASIFGASSKFPLPKEMTKSL